ncbi:unnamed protein product [Boreogadus saida]
MARSPPIIMLWLWLQSSMYLQGSNIHENPSLWGKKAEFQIKPCMWQLDPGLSVPELEELSVCVLLRLTVITEWTAFVYKAPGNPAVELGLEGDDKHLTAVLFGARWPLNESLTSKVWQSVCLTWSAASRHLRLYVNGTRRLDQAVDPPASGRLAPNGTLTLAWPHSVDQNGTVWREDGKTLMGGIGLFRMWAREWRAEEIRLLGCVEGDVVSWDARHWNHRSPASCPPKEDTSLHCEWSSYEIKMWAYIKHSNTSDRTNSSLESITRHWMESIFPLNFSVQNVSVLAQSRRCLAGDNPAALYIQLPQKSKEFGNFTFDYCFLSKVFVSISPKKSVESVQADIRMKLEPDFSYDSLTLRTDIHDLSIQPVAPLYTMTKPPPIVSESPRPATDTTFSFPTMSTDSTTEATDSTQRCPSIPTTTKVPLNNTVGIMFSFFEVNLTLKLNGNATNPTTVIECWLYERLVLNGMDMVDFWINSIRNMKQYGVQQIPHRINEEYNCTFHVRGNLLSTIKELETLIVGSLNQTFRNDTLSIQTTQLMVRYIGPKSCPEETLKTIYGVYLWPETFPQNKRALKCQRPLNRTAFRFCKFDVDSNMTSWEDPDMTDCLSLVNISDLHDHNVTAENAVDMMQTIQDLVDVELGSGSGSDGELSASDMVTVMGKLDDVVDVSVVTAKLSNDIFSMISDILISRSDMAPVSNMVLKLTERIGDKAVFSGDLFNVATPAMAVSMINVPPKNFRGITFCVSNYADGMTPELMVNESFAEAIPGTVASITLPAELKNQLAADGNKTRFQFQFYGVQDLFNDTDIAIEAEGNWTLNSYVISASINNRTVSNLNQRVEVTLSNNRAMQEHENVKCVFWDFGDNEGQGGWNSTGCETRPISANVTSCFCNHLTSFAVLLDISRAPMSEKDREILTLISYVGCGISSIFLGITLMTYLIFGKLRRDHPSKILINLSAALLALNLLYLLNTWMSSYGYGLCILTAVLMHFFLLASFTWMGLEALHMYFALIKVFNAYVRSYILKLCVVGWGVPLIIVGVVLATDVDAYGSSNITSAADETSEPFCWIQSDVHFYVTVAGFILLVMLGNTGVFVVVLLQIRRMRTNKPLGKPAAGGSAQELRAAASLTVLLGLTWLSAFFAVGPLRMVMLYLFCILNSLQGFFIFVFHCLTKENVRKQWRTRLTFDRFKPSDFSDWSRSTSRPKQEPNSHSMGSVDTSSIIKASEFSSTTECLPVHPGSEGAGPLLQVAQPTSTPNNIKTSVSWSNQ